MENVHKDEFIALRFTGYANGEMFDSNIKEDAKKLGVEEEPKEAIIVVGQKMVVPGLDNALEGKEVGKEYEVGISIEDGFGERKREYIKTIPLKVFTERKIYPSPGMMLTLDETLVKIIAVSGARVITDFNNPLSGKVLRYKFIITRKVSDENEKVRALCEMMFRFVPEFTIGEKVIMKGPKALGMYIKAFAERFKQLLGKEVVFEEKAENKKKEEIKTEQQSL